MRQLALVTDAPALATRWRLWASRPREHFSQPGALIFTLAPNKRCTDKRLRCGDPATQLRFTRNRKARWLFEGSRGSFYAAKRRLGRRGVVARDAAGGERQIPGPVVRPVIQRA